MERYTATVTESSRELSVKEKIKLKDEKLHQKLNVVLSEQVKEAGGLVLEPDGWARVHVKNPYSKQREEYDFFVIIEKNGDTWMTGSQSFMEAFMDIWYDMKEYPDEEFKIRVYTKDSKNYSSGFITCSIE